MKYNGNNLKEVLEAHRRWLVKSKGRLEKDRAHLSNADLRGAKLTDADLTYVDLTCADLSKANLKKAKLIYADLTDANLTGAYLAHADLTGADLRDANLRGACLFNANLTDANLTCADLREVCLWKAKNIPFIPLACPDTGAFVAWKKCKSMNGMVIVKLLIPEDARRSSGTGRKCRADRAVVLDIQTMDGDTLKGTLAWSTFDRGFTYEVGKTVTPNNPFCEDRFAECSSGIHFFINRQEAVEY